MPTIDQTESRILQEYHKILLAVLTVYVPYLSISRLCKISLIMIFLVMKFQSAFKPVTTLNMKLLQQSKYRKYLYCPHCCENTDYKYSLKQKCP